MTDDEKRGPECQARRRKAFLFSARLSRQGLFILSTQVALFRRDKQKSTALIVFPHIGVEVRHGAPFPGYVARAPLDEEADRKTPKHAQNPYSIRSPYPAGIITSAGVQPLM